MAPISEAVLGAWEMEGLLPRKRCSDFSVDGVEPKAVVTPSTVEGISRVLALASREGAFVVPYGGGTQICLGNRPRGVDLVVDLSSLKEVVDHQPSDLTATFQAGVTLEQANQVLASHGQILPLQAPDPKRATLGGILATAFSGPLEMTYGAPRDWLIGVKVVNSDGTVTKGGGRVVKNVTGYDMNKLYTGSLGTLGIIVEASFKLAPRPPSSRTFLATFLSHRDAWEKAWALRGQYGGPNALVLVNGFTLSRLGMPEAPWGLLAQYLGREGVVKAREEGGSHVCQEAGGGEIIQIAEQEALWQGLVDLPWVGENAPALGVRLGTLPSDIFSFMEGLDALDSGADDHGMVADVGTGTIRSLWWPQEDVPITEDIATRLTALGRERGTNWVFERCPLEIKASLDVWGPKPEALEVMRRVKARLDPRGLLNPGRFVGGI